MLTNKKRKLDWHAVVLIMDFHVIYAEFSRVSLFVSLLIARLPLELSILSLQLMGTLF